MTQALRNGYHATGIRLSLKGMVFYKADCLSCLLFFSPPFLAKFVVSRCAFWKLRKNFGFFCSFNHVDLLGNTCLLVIGAFWSTLFVSVFQGSLLVIALFRTVSGNDRLVFFEAFSWSFLFLSLKRIKQCLPPALNKNSTHHRDFLCYCWAV